MTDFVSFSTDCQSIYFMSTRFLKYNINEFVFQTFNFITLPTQLIFHIQNWLICIV